MNNFYSTDNLVLRVLNPDDCKIVLNFLKFNKAYFEPYESKRPDSFYTEAFQYDTLLAESSFFVQEHFMRYYMFLGDYTDPIGTVSFKKVTGEGTKTMSLGYKLDHRFWGMGFAHESISFLCGHIFSEHIADRLEAIVQPDNMRSIRLLKGLGFSNSFGEHREYELASGTVLHNVYYLTP